jgi:PAS domain S-box-containing protein
MPSKPKIDRSPAELRRRAEKYLGKPATGAGDAHALRMLHELDVHQIELEMQNAELRAARDEAENLLGQYTELYDFAPVGYFTLTPNGAIRRVNLTGATLVGSDRSKLVGHSFAMLLAASQRVDFKAFLEQVFEIEAKQSAEFHLRSANRIVSIQAQRSAGEWDCSAIVQDITERMQVREKMRLSEIRYRRLFEATQDGILLVDPGTSRIIEANPFMTLLLGYPREQLIGKELFEIGLLKDEAASRAMFRGLKSRHEVRYENLPLKSKTGRHQEVEVVANLYQENGQSVIQCNIRDITVRKLAEDMFRQNEKLSMDIRRSKVVEEDLRAKRKEQSRVLRQTRLQERQLRELSHGIMQAQEEERKRISRELHDVIAQALVSINLHLSVLAQDSAAVPESLKQQIGKTQLLVQKALQIVHEFARELRPTMLDDLGLIPALQEYMERFMEDTGIRVTLEAFAKIDQFTSAVRTVLYRVAQEALTNVARHSKASSAEVSIETLADVVRMTIKDNGQGFQVSGKAGSRRKNRLGLIGMRERVELIGGKLQVLSAPGGPTTIRVEIPAK